MILNCWHCCRTYQGFNTIVADTVSAFITLMVQALKPLLGTKDMGYTHPPMWVWVR